MFCFYRIIFFRLDINKKYIMKKISEKAIVRVDNGLSFVEAVFTAAFVIASAAGLVFFLGAALAGPFVELI